MAFTPDSNWHLPLHAWHQRHDVIYVHPLWRLLMPVIRAIPECLFKRLSL